MNWNDISYVVRSKYRLKILYVLKDGPLTPSSISDKTDVARSHVSRTLRELEARDLVKCLVEEIRGKFFEITDEGSSILSFIEERELSTN